MELLATILIVGLVYLLVAAYNKSYTERKFRKR
jgi:hypothetical protein